MIAAIYARKSSEQTGTAEEAKSVTRQIEHARACAAAKGWTVAEAHVYVDDGISGAEFAKRPGLVRLPRPVAYALARGEDMLALSHVDRPPPLATVLPQGGFPPSVRARP